MQTFCPKCGTKLGADESLIGKQVQCGKCSHRFTVMPIDAPAPTEEPEKFPEPPPSPMTPIGGDLPPIGAAPEPAEPVPLKPAAPPPASEAAEPTAGAK